MTKTPSANAAIAALRKEGIRDRLAGKVPGGVRVLLTLEDAPRAVEVLSARFPGYTVIIEDPRTVLIQS